MLYDYQVVLLGHEEGLCKELKEISLLKQAWALLTEKGLDVIAV